MDTYNQSPVSRPSSVDKSYTFVSLLDPPPLISNPQKVDPEHIPGVPDDNISATPPHCPPYTCPTQHKSDSQFALFRRLDHAFLAGFLRASRHQTSNFYTPREADVRFERLYTAPTFEIIQEQPLEAYIGRKLPIHEGVVTQHRWLWERSHCWLLMGCVIATRVWAVSTTDVPWMESAFIISSCFIPIEIFTFSSLRS